MNTHFRTYRLLLGILLLLSAPLRADTLTLQGCYGLAHTNFPLLQQNRILDDVLTVKLQTWNSYWLPAINLNGSATYQSDVPSLSINIPGQSLSLDLPKDRYQLYAELNQTIYDGGVVKANKQLENSQDAINRQKVLVNEQQLKDQLINVYFSVLLLDQQKAVLLSTRELLESRKRSVESAREQDMATRSSVLQIDAELIKLNQALREIEENSHNSREILSILTGIPMDASTQFEIPDMSVSVSAGSLHRPEITLLELQQNHLRASGQLTKTQNLPKLSAFAQGGVGYPNPYNFFDNKMSPFYIFGARMTWAVWNRGLTKKQNTYLELQAQLLESEKENLDRNLHIQMSREASRIAQLEDVLTDDEQLVVIQEQLRVIAEAQLDEGVITQSDYLETVTREQQAKLNRETRRIQLELAKTNYINQQGTLFN